MVVVSATLSENDLASARYFINYWKLDVRDRVCEEREGRVKWIFEISTEDLEALRYYMTDEVLFEETRGERQGAEVSLLTL